MFGPLPEANSPHIKRIEVIHSLASWCRGFYSREHFGLIASRSNPEFIWRNVVQGECYMRPIAMRAAGMLLCIMAPFAARAAEMTAPEIKQLIVGKSVYLDLEATAT